MLSFLGKKRLETPYACLFIRISNFKNDKFSSNILNFRILRILSVKKVPENFKSHQTIQLNEEFLPFCCTCYQKFQTARISERNFIKQTRPKMKLVGWKWIWMKAVRINLKKCNLFEDLIQYHGKTQKIFLGRATIIKIIS